MTYLSNEGGTELTPEEQLILMELADLGTPGQVPTVNPSGTGLEYEDIPSGPTGYTGYTGYTGPGNFTGYTGYTGYTGPTGYTGYTGPSITGYTGYTGYTGRTGYTGYTGYTGRTGYTGPTGPTGYTGRTGYTGYTGTTGYTGYTGYGNFTGYTGYTGYTGPATISSVSNSDGTLTISPTTGAVVASIALGHSNIWTGKQYFTGSVSNFYIGTDTTYGYTLGRNTSTGLLDIVGTQGFPFDGVAVGKLTASDNITINGENVLRNWSLSVGLGTESGGGAPGAVLEIRNSNQNFWIGGGAGAKYEIKRNGGTGFMEFTGDQAGYTAFIFNTGNKSNALYIEDGGKVGIWTASPTAAFDINSDIVRLRTSKTPASATASGNAGDICWDSGYIYVCTATNTWVRSALTTW